MLSQSCQTNLYGFLSTICQWYNFDGYKHKFQWYLELPPAIDWVYFCVVSSFTLVYKWQSYSVKPHKSICKHDNMNHGESFENITTLKILRVITDSR